eukprot:COSAG01_NODE_47129_length_393_cov_1.040816_1_plen_54_part_10
MHVLDLGLDSSPSIHTASVTHQYGARGHLHAISTPPRRLDTSCEVMRFESLRKT